MTVNISEKLVFQKFGEQLYKFAIPEKLKPVTESMLKDIYEDNIKHEENTNEEVKKDLLKLQSKKSFLVDNFLEGNISKEIYAMKLLEIEKQEVEFDKKLQPIKKITAKKLKEIKKRAELFVSLYTSYPKETLDEKLNILKILGAELSVNTKKELQIAENKLMKLL